MYQEALFGMICFVLFLNSRLSSPVDIEFKARIMD